jgi:hypothetical protein
MDYYPKEFSAQARARVEAEQIIAKRDFERAQSEKPPNKWGKDRRTWDECLFYRYILRVFLVFALEACKIGKQGIWAVDRIRAEAEEFLRRFTIRAYCESGRDRYGEKFEDMTSNWNGSLLPEVKRIFQKSEALHRFEAELLAVAQLAADSTHALDENLKGNPAIDVLGAGPTISEVPPATMYDGDPSLLTTAGDAIHNVAEKEIEVNRNPRVRSDSLSARETQIHKIVGEGSFRTLTNAEIMKTPGIGRRLRDEYELRSEDAAKSCLDRIRNARGYPLSREISRRRSAQS